MIEVETNRHLIADIIEKEYEEGKNPFIAADLILELLGQPPQVSVEPVVKPEIAITIIKTKITQLEELAEKYKDEWDVESYADCLGQRNTLNGVLTEIEKQFSV